jgi:hypothetical protein
LLDSLGIAHSGPKHRIIWKVIKGESIFGLVHIHAVLECSVCGVRRKPEVFHKSDFKESGVHRISYTLETNEKVGP